MAKVSMLAKLVVHDGKGDELIAAFSDLFGQVEQEPGTEVYVMNRSSSDPNVFWFYELYSDGAALGAHAGSEAMKNAMGSMGELVASSELILSTPIQAKGVAT